MNRCRYVPIDYLQNTGLELFATLHHKSMLLFQYNYLVLFAIVDLSNLNMYKSTCTINVFTTT